MTHAPYLYAPINRPPQEAAPKGYTLVQGYSRDHPYGVICYLNPLDAMTAWRYELRNLTDDYVVGETVEYVLNGKLYSGVITQIDNSYKIWVDDYETLPHWALHRPIEDAK